LFIQFLSVVKIGLVDKMRFCGSFYLCMDV